MARMWWWSSSEDNFGDWIGPWICKHVTGHLPQKAIESTVEQPSIYAVGSIIGALTPGAIVWGTGIIKFSDSPLHGQPGDVRSVRGPLTRRRLEELQISCPPVYGDAAMIMPKYVPAASNAKKYKLGIIPHYVDYENVMTLDIAKDPRVLVINLKTRDIDGVLNQLMQCEKTISSSLHGVIVSVAYGIPTRWFMIGNKICGDHVKYWDFFLSLHAKDEHDNLMNSAITIIKHHETTKQWSTSNPELENYLPLDYRERTMTFDDAIAATVKYKVTPTLIADIETTCPLQSGAGFPEGKDS